MSTKKQQELGNLIRQVKYPNRLAIFGIEYLKEFCKSLNVNIEVIEDKIQLGPNEEMVNDLISVVTCFRARMYGVRGGRKINKRIIN